MAPKKRTAPNPFDILIEVASGECPKKAYPFQQEAYRALDKFYAKNNQSGLLVLPTGGGKTFTALSWLLKNATNKNRKIIWIAHRHELLEQVKDEITKLAYESVLPDKKGKKISVQLISGSHERAVHIRKDTDILIAGILTLNRNIDFLRKRYLQHNQDLFFVIDEAHHATARTYRYLTEEIKKSCKNYNILGLTATPFRTSEKEKSFLAKIFHPKPIYAKDLQDLIIAKILAKPNFVSVETDTKFSRKDFSEEELKLLQSHFDLPENVKQKIIQQSERNDLIVRHYLENKEKYKQTIFFALNRDHAVQLDALLKSKGVKSKFIISGTQSFIGISTDKEENHRAIQEFRQKKLESLVNVNILTEGTDLPNAQTVFLTRPTSSKTLMTQMVGRALRGPKAGGTEEAYIVSFIDDWDDLVAWENPAELYVDEIDFSDESTEKRQYKVQFISLELIQQFSLMANDLVDTELLEAYPAIMRIPIGWYSFQLENSLGKEDIDYKSCKILVYEQHKAAFEAMEKNMEKLYKKYDYDKNNILDDKEKEDLLEEIQKQFFAPLPYPEPKIKTQDLLDILNYYDATKTFPVFFTFEEREQYDIQKLAQHILDNDLTRSEEGKFIEGVWEGTQGNSIWKDFYGNNKNFFKSDVDREIRKLQDPTLIENLDVPKVEFREEKLENLRLEHWPKKERLEIKKQVFAKWNRENPGKQIPANERWKYQIDHIIPHSKGGKTVLENLQLLPGDENRRKGDQIQTS